LCFTALAFFTRNPGFCGLLISKTDRWQEHSRKKKGNRDCFHGQMTHF
jgi:hypothetical protein